MRAVVLTAAVLLVAGCAVEPEPVATEATTTEVSRTIPPSSEPEPTPPAYLDFADIDTDTHPYFIQLEDTDTVDGHGEERTWGLGVRACSRLDAGATFDEVIANIDESNVDAAPTLVASAVNHICEHHRAAAQDWVDANDGARRTSPGLLTEIPHLGSGGARAG